eukprot:CAMPEP_0197842282 /NCGR_PEP_ID=MMETSP1437-20131217/46651_1 /TAXON_ID=49252 ORGANISM="Eucampia antarctica, Strain CCMP1452" /NCGR_SAMPLE_ID=MMETSP1437 /ASSEMBLY_ACC=CAM_ASM_001096 /LENGTH=400 /DNA_ID=CAMNT_0043452139 /DNA_START=116 /DNA_END=1318 /DNA_ORIENTATION=-
MRIPCVFNISLLFGVLITLSNYAHVRADGVYYDDAQEVDDNVEDEEVYADDYIKYWTEYAVLPKKCITYNNVDMIVFSVFPQGYRSMCTDEPMGTYMTTVPTFVGAYMDQLEANALDQGVDDYAAPESLQFIECYPFQTNEALYYVQVGCTDGTSQSLSVNIYKDNTCETPWENTEGSDDASFDISDIQVPFKQCQACVIWIDKDDDQGVDDQYFENKKTQAPLCSEIWSDKEVCDKKCQKMGFERKTNVGWNTSDKVLLSILTVFGAGMLFAILRKRSYMSKKDSLLEEAAMNAAGLQQSHVIGIFILTIVVILVFALLGLKSITWALMLIVNTVLFGYLMKLTVDSGVSAGSTVVGPDGQIIQRDDSDSSDDEDEGKKQTAQSSAGAYQSPTIIPPIS